MEVPILLKRKRRKRRALIISTVSIIGIIIFIIIAFSLMYVDKLTISVQDPELSLSIDENKEHFVTSLNAPPLLKATDTQYSDIPEDIDEKLGSKNTDYYFAYSFLLKGVGEMSNINYSMSVKLDKTTQEIEKAMRIMIIKDGIKRVYAQPQEDGSPRPIYDGQDRDATPTIIGTTIPFKENKHIILEPYSIIPDEYSKFTLVMWIDGWESVNAMKGGIVQMDLIFSTISIQETR